MQLATQLQLLQSQLNIPSDKHNYIIPTICNNFVRKYQQNLSINVDQLTQQFKYVLQQIDIYSQYTYQTISKYQSLNKLQVLVRSIIQGQMSILVYFGNVVGQSLRQRNKYQQKLQNISYKAYQRCQNCSKPLKRAQIQTIQDQIGLKFKDAYSYFTHDIDQINKLSEQASLIFRKKILNLEGIAEEEYMYKFQKVKQNISTTIQHVTCSLNKITLFQQKFAELQQYQYMSTRNQKQKFNQDKFDSKKYMVNMSKHFYNSIKNLQQKLNRIKSFFKVTVTRQTQTKNQFNQCTPQKLEQLKNALTKSEIQRKQIQIYMSSADQQLTQTKQKLRNCQDKLYAIKQEKQKLNEKYKILQIQLQMRKEYSKTLQKKSQKTLQINNTQKKKKSIISSKINNEQKNKKNSFFQKNKINHQQSKQIQNIENQNIRKQQKKSGISKKYQNNSFNHKNQIPPFQQTQINLLAPPLQKSKINTDQSFRSEQNDLSKSKLLLSQKSLLKQPRLQQYDLVRNKQNTQKQQFINQIKRQQSPIKVFVQQKISCSQSYRIINRGFFNYFIQYSLQILPSQILENHSRNDIHQQTKQFQHRKRKNYIKYLQQIYKQLSHSQQNLHNILNQNQFISKINSYIQNIININQQKQTQHNNNNYNSQQQFSKTKNKAHKLTKSSYQNLKTTKPIHKNRSQLTSIKPIQQPHLQKFNTTNMTKKSLKSKRFTQTNFQQLFEQKIKKNQVRNSLNVLQQIQNNKLQKYNGFISVDSLSNKANLLQNLPLLKKRNRQQSLTVNKQNCIPEEQLIQCHITQAQKPQFTQQDIKNIYHSLQNAYKLGQTSIKNCKNQLSVIDQQQFFHPCQLSYIKQFFTRMAHIHLNNKQIYQNIKMFLICPYDYVVSQMAKLNIIKSYSSPNAMRESLKKIIILHRLCTTKGDICKHLKYLLGKIAYLQRSIERQ